jgi:hypothetical protein
MPGWVRSTRASNLEPNVGSPSGRFYAFQFSYSCRSPEVIEFVAVKVLYFYAFGVSGDSKWVKREVISYQELHWEPR